MSEVFRTGDLLNSLVELEKTGHDFYLKMSRQSRDAKRGDLFRFLAGEEAKHEKIYTDLSNEFSGSTTAHEEVDEDYGAYLKALLSQHFNFSAADLDTPEAALKFAVSLEKDTLIYLGELQSVLKGWKADLFERIKKEERNHLRMLADLSR